MPSKSKATIEITAEDKASRQLQKVSKQFKGLSRDLTKAGKAASIGFTAPVVAGFGASLKAFDQQEKALAQVKSAIESTGNAAKISFGDLQKEASRLQGKSLFGDEDILANVTSQLQTFTNIAGDEFKRTQQAALDLATRLDGDLKSSSIQLGKALNDPVKNLSALSRSGIQFSKSQTEMIKGLAESGKLSEAQSVILGELEKQYGGAAEAAAKAGLGTLKQLQNRIGDFSERIGKALLPVIEAISPHIERVVSHFEEMDDKTIAIGVAIAGAVAAIGPALLIFGQLAGAVSSITGALAAASGASALFGTTLAVITGPVGITIAAIAAGAALIIANWDQIKASALALKDFVVASFEEWKANNGETIARIAATFEGLKATWEQVRESASGVFTAVSGFVTHWAGVALEKVNAVAELFGGWDNILEGFGNLFSDIFGLVGDVIGNFGDYISAQFDNFKNLLEGNISVWEFLGTGIGNSINLIKDVIGSMATFVIDRFKSIGDFLKDLDFKGLGKALMQGLANGIKSAINAPIEAVKGAGTAISSAFKRITGIRSPSRVFKGFGSNIIAGLTIGLSATAPAEQAAEALAKKTLDKFEQAAGNRGSSPQDIISQSVGNIAGDFSGGQSFGGQGGTFGGQGGGSFGQGGGFGSEQGGFGQGGFNIPGQQEIEGIKAHYDERLTLLTARGLEETELAKTLETDRANALADIRSQQIAGYGQSFDSILGLTKSFAGEQSGIYQGLFAASKAFAIAESIIKIQQGVANALSLPFPANLAAAATVATQASGIVSTIQGTQPSFEGGGFTGLGGRTGGVDGRGGIPAIVHPNETILDHTRGQGMGGVTINLTISGNPDPEVADKIKNEAVNMALRVQAENERRGGSRSF